MSDRELLVLAAKAAGIELEWYPEYCINEDGLDWNPLTDDGDAFRLAVKLELSVMQPSRSEDKGVLVLWEHGAGVREIVGNDPYAATRRAIVQAAAEIGKTMP